MKYEYYGYTIEMPLELYLEGTDEEIKDYCLSLITEVDKSSPNNIDTDFNEENENTNFHEFD